MIYFIRVVMAMASLHSKRTVTKTAMMRGDSDGLLGKVVWSFLWSDDQGLRSR